MKKTQRVHPTKYSDKVVTTIARILIVEKWTTRQLAQCVRIPYNSVWYMLRVRLPVIDKELHVLVHRQLKQNLTHWKGEHANGLRKMD